MRKVIGRTGLIILIILIFVLASLLPLSPHKVVASNLSVTEGSASPPSLEEEGIALGLPSNPLQWCIVETPGSVAGKYDILSPSEVNKIAIAADGVTIWAVDMPSKAIRKSTDSGWWWTDAPNASLHSAMTSYGIPEANQVVCDVAVAPDDPNFVALVTGSATSPNPTDVWVSELGGVHWACAELAAVSGGATIGSIDISMEYGGKRDIAVGARDGAPGAFRIWGLQCPGFAGWNLQTVVPVANADVVALRFSPTYFDANTGGDAALAVVYCDAAATYFDIALRDRNPDVNDIVTWVYGNAVEVNDPSSAVGASPEATTIVAADLELPSDFDGQSASLRRTYISLDAVPSAASWDETGIYRIDDNVVYELMDTTGPDAHVKRVSSIAYCGTCASGKLLVGEVLGSPCLAAVQTWFTDSPTVCPIPVWYPSLKPTTGAANQGTCEPAWPGASGYGNAQVAWSPDGEVAYCGTSSADFANGGTSTAPGSGCWPEALTNSVALDESAFSISRNNGETWNQTGLIDTRIDKLTDVVPSADSCTVYVASVNTNAGCSGFDSVWRSSTNPGVVAPLPVESIGTVWERILCRVTAGDCTGTQSNHAILRLAPDKTDGEIVFWAAQGSTGPWPHGVVAWSPNYGDYWANINPRLTVQDLVAESSTVIYILQADGLVQKMPYTGTAWSSAKPNADTSLGSGYSIAALAEGHVLVGASVSSGYPVAYSGNGASSFTVIPELLALSPSNVHVAFDADFVTNGVIYAATENTADPGSIYRNTVPAYTQWTDLEPLALGYYGLAIGTQGTLYAANPLFVERTLYPEADVPGDLGEWDVLISGLPGLVAPSASSQVFFTPHPSSLKVSGCLISDTNTKLWAIDDNSYVSPTANCGRLWIYEDCLAKAGPVGSGPATAECDPVSGINPQINLSWEQLCWERFYEVQIADDADFTEGIWRHVWYEPPDISSPGFVVPAGGMPDTSVNAPSWVDTLPDTVAEILGVSPNMDVIGLESVISVPPLYPECGHTYYWRIRAVGSAHDDLIRSLWSETQSFTITGSGLPPKVKTHKAKNITDTSAMLRGRLIKLGTASEVTVSFLWGATEACADGETTKATSSKGDFTCDLSGLLPNTTYYFKAKAVGDGTTYGAVESFTTSTGGEPSAPTLLSPNIPGTSITFTWNASPGATKYRLEVNGNLSWGKGTRKCYEDVGNVLSKTVTGFPNDGTMYYWRVWAGNDAGWSPSSSSRSFINGP